jgi:hypothetical protein
MWPDGNRTLCGDNPNDTRLAMPGDIVATYQRGSVIEMSYFFTTNHLGHLSARLCRLGAKDESECSAPLQRWVPPLDGAPALPIRPAWRAAVHHAGQQQRATSSLGCSRQLPGGDLSLAGNPAPSPACLPCAGARCRADGKGTTWWIPNRGTFRYYGEGYDYDDGSYTQELMGGWTKWCTHSRACHCKAVDHCAMFSAATVFTTRWAAEQLGKQGLGVI